MLEHGFIDKIVERKDLKQCLFQLIGHMRLVNREAVGQMEFTAWDRYGCQGNDRPTSLYYIEHIFEDFQELHGDRNVKVTRPLWAGDWFSGRASVDNHRRAEGP